MAPREMPCLSGRAVKNEGAVTASQVQVLRASKRHRNLIRSSN